MVSHSSPNLPLWTSCAGTDGGGGGGEARTEAEVLERVREATDMWKKKKKRERKKKERTDEV